MLIILDDVDNSKNLEQLIGDYDCFGPQSRIIITTKDERVIREVGVNSKYKVEKLNYEESIRLFN